MVSKHSSLAGASKPSGKLPTKWVVALLAGLVIYALVQPIANRQFGWSLPSVQRLLGQKDDAKEAGSADAKSVGRQKSSTVSASSENGELSGASPAGSSNNRSSLGSSAGSPAPPLASRPDEAGRSESSPADPSLKYGFLRALGGDIYQSPAGLQYVPMRGEEEHRLNHVARHLKDIPSRDVHSVFDGDMEQVLRWIDDAYLRAKSGAKGTSKENSGSRIVYEASFDKSIGYTGGQRGKRQRYPEARNLRLVVEGVKVVTAFPFD